MSDKFGINIKQYCREHEAALREGKVSLKQHLEKLRWLQHERLVHLIVDAAKKIVAASPDYDGNEYQYVVGTMAQWTGNAANAWRMLGVHWAGAAIASLLWWLIPPGPASKAAPVPQAQRCTLPRAIEQSCRALLSVCGAMMLFAIASAVVQKGLGAAFPRWTQAHGKELAILWALLEIGGGAKAVIDAFPAPPWAFLCALCSFGGVSILLQNLLFVGEKIRPARLAAMRLLHGAVSFVLFSLLF